MLLRFSLPTILTIVVTVFFLALERLAPGRKLPQVRGWYARALALNLVQMLITLGLNRVWRGVFDGPSLLRLAAWNRPVLEGLSAWLVGTFFFYWWHRIRHARGFWRLFHQVHHSPARIEAVTSFYKHPLEIFSDSLLSALVLYPLLGASLTGAFWSNFFAATGEYFYHANFKSPRWLRYFIQTPELHSVHHQLDVHRYNFSDLPLWDRLFGTYRDTIDFAPACGFPRNNERHLRQMVAFRDVYDHP
ncbi:MAG TPA: sterol desaturase family protein [Polyangiaceae bacterium]|jgi:sterol desaturase/sphingolipid hydroxylase (fatty acid hydroxylase superfamily)|nr:sterol desaturase family protein [Polyangiaceae bacterium]